MPRKILDQNDALLCLDAARASGLDRKTWARHNNIDARFRRLMLGSGASRIRLFQIAVARVGLAFGLRSMRRSRAVLANTAAHRSRGRWRSVSTRRTS